MSKVKLIMVKLCAVCLCCVYAEVEIDASYKSEEVDGVRWYYSIDENGRVKLGAKDVEGNVMPAISENTVGDITIPSVLGGCIVDRIGDRAFMDCNQITSVTMSDSVKSIGRHAFRHCTQLQNGYHRDYDASERSHQDEHLQTGRKCCCWSYSLHCPA